MSAVLARRAIVLRMNEPPSTKVTSGQNPPREWARALPLWLPAAGVLLGLVVGAIHGSDPSSDFIAFSRGAWMLILAIMLGGIGLGLGVLLWLAMAARRWLARRAE